MNSAVTAALRDEVLRANQAIPRAGLATLTWGNVSGVDRDAGVYVIKPSGVSYDGLTADQLVVVGLEDGRVVEGHLRPSVDSETHRRLYLAFGGVGGITHTHSPSAVAFAQAKRDIPVLGTTHADAFNGPIRCTRDLTEAECAADYEYNTGQAIVDLFGTPGDDPEEVPGALAANHGPFVWGEIRRSVAEERDHLRGGRADGHPDAGAEPARRCPAVSARTPLPPQARTGRVLRKSPGRPARSTALMTAPTAQDDFEVWFLTGSQHLYGEETLRQVAEQSRGIAAVLSEAEAIRVKLVWKPVLTDHDAIRRTMLEANADDRVIGLVAWMHTFSPAKMWIAGLSALDKPLLHLHTQANVALPWATIDFDFMNLNQAAHGDREFGYVLTRLGVPRKTVAGHVSDPRVVEQVATWTRAAAGWAATRSLRLARFGDNMRYVAVTEGDKTEAEAIFGVQVNTWGVNDLVAAVDAAAPADVDALVAEYEDTYDVAPELRLGKERHQSLRDGAAIELGLRSFLDAGGFGAFTTNFEDLGGLKQLPGLAVQRLMADGYGFGAEGDWKTAVLVRAAKVMGAGLPGGASLMEDYTYDLTPGSECILGAHMLEVCPSLTSAKPRLEIHPLSIGGREDPVRLVFSADPGPGVVVALSDMRDRFRLVANVVEVIPPAEPLPRLPVGRAVWRPEPDFQTSATSWLQAGAAHHTCMSTAVGIEAFADYARMAGTELLVIDETTTAPEFENRIRANAAYYRLARGI